MEIGLSVSITGKMFRVNMEENQSIVNMLGYPGILQFQEIIDLTNKRLIIMKSIESCDINKTINAYSTVKLSTVNDVTTFLKEIHQNSLTQTIRI